MPPGNTSRRDGRPEALSTSTTVAIRLRPLNDREKGGGQKRIWRCVPTHNSITQTSPEGNPLPDGKGTFFTYDRIFDEDSSTEAVYDGTTKEIVHAVSRGMNGTIFAYGQTSSGKTFTMQGGGSESTPGIVQIATKDLFRLIQDKTDRMFLMRVSYLEIYQEEVRDLLNPENTNMQVREDPRKGVYIDAHEETVGDFETVLRVLRMGEKQRHVGCTEMNSRSSRSHTIFRLVVESQEMFDQNIHASPEEVDPSTLVATLNLVDLAGSESVRHTGATGIRQKEGGMINQSLLTLSRVIQTLSQPGHSHVNYRDSKLTRILQPSLSGNARMAIICCATAAEGFLEETRSTLQFASRAKEIKNQAVVNEIVDDKTQIRRMTQELAALKRKHAEQQAAGGGGGGELVEALQQEKAEQAEKIDRLKKLLLNIAPAVEEEGGLLELHLVSPRYRRGKRSRETWCPGNSSSAVKAPRSLVSLSPGFPSLGFHKSEEDCLAKRRSSEAALGTAPGATAAPAARLSEGCPRKAPASAVVGAAASGDREVLASKLEEALAARKETEDEMKEFVAYTEDVERVLASTKALLAQESEAARKAADDVAVAMAAAEAATLREQEVTAALQERIAALEAEKLELEEQEAVLRAENEEAAAIIAENQAGEPSFADADVQTNGPDSDESAGGVGGGKGAAFGRSVAHRPAEADERDLVLANLAKRVEELEGILVEAKEEQREQAIRSREDKQKADESVVEALAAQRRAEDAFSAACQSELEMRCRLESAMQQMQQAEEARDAMAAKAAEVEEAAASGSKELEEALQVLGDRMTETQARLEAAEQQAASVSTVAEQAKAASVEETNSAMRKLLAHEAASAGKDRIIADLTDLVESLRANGEQGAEEKMEEEDDAALSQQLEQLLSDKRMAEESAAAVRADNEALRAKIDDLSAQLASSSGEAEAEAVKARAELAAATEAASVAEAKAAEDMARVVEEAMASSERVADLQYELESKAEAAVKFAEEIESLESQLKAVQDDASKQAAAEAARIAEIEGQVEEAAGLLLEANEAAASAAAAAAAEKQGSTDSEKLLAEVKDELALANKLLVTVQDAAAEKESASAARIAELQGELSAATASMAAAQASAKEREASAAERIAEVESELSAANEQLVIADESNAARVEELENDLKTATESFGVQLMAAEETNAARIIEVEAQLNDAADKLGEVLMTAEKSKAEAEALRETAALADGLTAELGALREENASATATHEAETSELRCELERVRASLEAKDGEVADLQQQAAAELVEAQEAAAAADATIAEKENTIAAMKESLEAGEALEGELTQALEDSENLSKEVLDLTDQLMEKDADLVQLREQLEARIAELAALRAAQPVLASSMSDDGFDGEATETSSELRRLRSDLDRKGSELDKAIKENEVVRAELKEVKNMLGAAANVAGAASADEDSLRKRISQLVCENGLLKGEKDRQEALAAEASLDVKSTTSRSAAEIERLEIEVARLSRVAGMASDVAAEGDRAKVALCAMESKLSELRQERTELQGANQRYLDRCSEAERVAETLQDRLAELEGRDFSRDAIVALETKVDALEQEVRRVAAAKAQVEGDARENANRVKRLQGEVEMIRSEYEVISEEVLELRGSLTSAEAKLREAHALHEAAVSDYSEDRSTELEAEIARLRDQLSDLENAHLEALGAEVEKRSELQAAHGSTVAALEKMVSELQDANAASSAVLAKTVSELRAEHDEAVTALEDKISESLELAEQIEADHDGNLAALREQMEASHAGEISAVSAQLSEALQEVESKEAAAAQLSEECEALSAELKRVGEAAKTSTAEISKKLDEERDGRKNLERRLVETVDAGKATEEQLRHRLTSQVAEAENLRQELLDARERSDRAEAAVRASDQRARESADEKTKGLLAEMENLCQEKLIAEDKAGNMEAELVRLREAVATAEQTAAKDQGMLIRAAEERMAVLDKDALKKDITIAELQASLNAVRASAESSLSSRMEEATAALNNKVATLTDATGEYRETIKKQEARIKKLEQVRLTNGQVEKLQAMKATARRNAAENVELKQRLSILKERLEAGGIASAGAAGEGVASKQQNQEASSVAAALAAATERNVELQGAKDTLVERLKEYGKRVYELQKENTRVRAAVEELGGSVPEGGDLGDAVLECAQRFVGRGDGSMLSTGSHDDAIAAAAVSEELQQRLQEAREALQKEEAGRALLKEQMVAGVAKFRALEAQEKAARERVESMEAEHKAALSAAIKMKGKDHEREVKFLQEENVQLFKEIADWKLSADQLAAEVKVLRGKLADVQAAHQAPPSATKKRALGDRTNSTPTEATSIAGKPGITAPAVKPAAAAERRAASRALIDGAGPVNDEGAGECNQS